MIKILKLVTGEEVVSTTETTPEGDLKLSKPFVLQLVPSRTNPSEPSLGLLPFAALVENQTIVIPKSAVLYTAEPIKELYNQYNSVAGTGIVI